MHDALSCFDILFSFLLEKNMWHSPRFKFGAFHSYTEVTCPGQLRYHFAPAEGSMVST